MPGFHFRLLRIPNFDAGRIKCSTGLLQLSGLHSLMQGNWNCSRLPIVLLVLQRFTRGALNAPDTHDELIGTAHARTDP